jgi:hypothetical protein
MARYLTFSELAAFLVTYMTSVDAAVIGAKLVTDMGMAGVAQISQIDPGSVRNRGGQTCTLAFLFCGKKMVQICAVALPRPCRGRCL